MRVANTDNRSRPEQNILHEDRRFLITTADVRTPTAYYPISDTVGRVRYDILYAAIFYATLVGFALFIYFDLWRWNEVAIMCASILAALLTGFNIAVLQLDARGFPSRLFVARAKTVRKIFKAITLARARASTPGGGFEPEELSDVD